MLTAHLDLAPMTPADAPAVAAVLTDPRLWGHDPTARPATAQAVTSWAARAATRWVEDDLSYWTVRLRATGEVVGHGGAQRHPPGHWNLSYRIADAHQGRGYAGELLEAALSAASSVDPDLARIAWVDVANHTSRRVAERAGLAGRGLRRCRTEDPVRLAYADRPLDDDRYPRVG